MEALVALMKALEENGPLLVFAALSAGAAVYLFKQFYKEVTARRERAEGQVDTILPAVRELKDAVHIQNEIVERMLSVLTGGKEK